jgi:glycosyltransferase involved in cell wall biosynthesis
MKSPTSFASKTLVARREIRYPKCVNKPLPLSVALITLNEESNLPRCLESVRELASEIVVIDSGSTDRTAEVAARFHAHFESLPWRGYVAQKNAALERCTQPWVLCLDADEAVSPELASAIRGALANGQLPERGLFANRLNFYCGDWIHHAWYPEWRLRLARRESAQWVGLDLHERLEVKGPTRRLGGDLWHYPFNSFRDHFQKAIKYAGLAADSYARNGRPFRWYQALFSPWLAFLKVLILKGGWRDGWRGWAIAGARWLEVFAKYCFLLEHRWLRRVP